MALIVQKFGGTSVGDLDRIRNVAARVQQEVDAMTKAVLGMFEHFGESPTSASTESHPSPRPTPFAASLGAEAGPRAG